MTRSGITTHARAALAAAALSVVALAAAQPEGAEIYAQHCASCHGTSGAGTGGFPALVDNPIVLGEPREMVRVVLWGRGGMPAFAGQLDDAEIAAVTTHERTSWGNDAEPIEEAFVAEVREDEEDEADAVEGAGPAPEDVEVELPDDWFVQGRNLYHRHCVACHQADGGGIDGAFPRIAENPFVTGPVEPVLHVVLRGRAGMPTFGGLDDEKIAIIVSYVRQAWENDAHMVGADMVATVREGDELDLTPTSPLDRPGAGN